MNQSYVVKLTPEDRSYLENLMKSGSISVRVFKKAFILLQSDQSKQGPGWTYEKIMAAYHVSQMLITETRKKYVAKGLPEALYRKKPDREYRSIIDGEAEAQLIAIACGKPPEGRVRWTLRLLRDHMVAAGYVEQVSHETIRKVMKKTNLSLGSKNNGASHRLRMRPS
jgi:hypothetical protein